MGKKLYLKLMKYSFPERKKRALETYTMEMEVLEKMSFRELNFEYVNTKAAYEHQKNIMGIFAISFIISVLMGIWKGLFSMIVKAIYYWGRNQTSEAEIIALALFFVIFGGVVITVFLGMFLYKNLKKTRNLYKRILMLEEVRSKKNECD